MSCGEFYESYCVPIFKCACERGGPILFESVPAPWWEERADACTNYIGC